MGSGGSGLRAVREATVGARFVQSVADFPLLVSLGRKTPSWGLNRWAGCCLRFIPPDDEGFSLRGDKQRLVYKGRRCSHRFTILGNNVFEYDVILKKEPESNIVSLTMEGAEQFDFFRQPDFLQEPLVAGSYAVYKKETLIGEGTGKLCHIHRPEIIDAKGRRCRGDLAVAGSELRITIPEKFLSEAVYPVIVDPTIGTATVGSQNLWDYEDVGEEPRTLSFEMSIPVNRFLISEPINGQCTAYVYTNEDDREAGGRPVFYSDNGDKPQARKSKQEGLLDLRVVSGKPKGWRNTIFSSNGSIASGSYIWFGVFSEYYWLPRFDYGAKCYRNDWWDYDMEDAIIPELYPHHYLVNYCNLKLSMYFTYTSSQNHIRTLTQGVSLVDSRKLTGAYKRTAMAWAQGTAALSRFAMLPRSLPETATASVTTGHWRAYVRGLYHEAGSIAETVYSGAYFRIQTEIVRSYGAVFRGLLIFVKILTLSLVRDFLLRRFLKSNEELVLKSGICQEITLDSRV
jgi:hypothetical protein